jgi:hypothetical protein
LKQTNISLLFTSILFFLGSFSFSQPLETSSRKTKKEIIKTDITKYADITADEILVFGAALEMDYQTVERELSRYPEVYMKVDPFNENRFYLYENDFLNGNNVILAYFIWDEEKKALQEIVLYFGFIKYLVGNSKNLLTTEVINKDSRIIRDFLGPPTEKEITLDIEALGLKSFSYFYPERKFKVIRNISDDKSSIAFSFYL